mmetsp:Transcript_119525/g.273934  ORF Transcript_119525/g.273934 Transcript_119525/m.273934 type:complete len:301 (-) Transcript_119525:2286-3188(-)
MPCFDALNTISSWIQHRQGEIKLKVTLLADLDKLGRAWARFQLKNLTDVQSSAVRCYSTETSNRVQLEVENTPDKAPQHRTVIRQPHVEPLILSVSFDQVTVVEPYRRGRVGFAKPTNVYRLHRGIGLCKHSYAAAQPIHPKVVLLQIKLLQAGVAAHSFLQAQQRLRLEVAPGQLKRTQRLVPTQGLTKCIHGVGLGSLPHFHIPGQAQELQLTPLTGDASGQCLQCFQPEKIIRQAQLSQCSTCTPEVSRQTSHRLPVLAQHGERQIQLLQMGTGTHAVHQSLGSNTGQRYPTDIQGP